MAYWKPGAPGPPAASDLDYDAERHRAPPVFNPDNGLPVQQQRKRLPIYRHRLALLHALETHRVVVLCGPTGSGKSTQLAQYLDEAGWASAGYVVGVTLPRRIAAVTVATRVAQEMGVELGKEVGYRIRFDSHVTPKETRIEFMTDGVLLREMMSDPLLTRYSVIVIDEAHERGIQTDLLLGMIKKIMRKRPCLRLVVASATADVDAFLNFFHQKRSNEALVPPTRKRPRCGWDDETGEFHKQRVEDADWRRLCQDLGNKGECIPERSVCLVAFEGRTHPVKIHYLEEPACNYLETAVGVVMTIHEKKAAGDILVFLTGREEIENACALLRERLAQARERASCPSKKPRPLHVVPLCGSLTQESQLKAFYAAPHGARKVVVSTNLAEASVTIPGIVYVVDSCLVKFDAFCMHNSTSYQNVTACSRSSARQRAGRAGRIQAGNCYRLLTEAAFTSTAVPEHTQPEIVRTDLKDVILLMKCLGIDDVGAFEFVTPPRRESMENALEELYALGALDDEARVVEPLGPRMAHGPLPLVLMRLLLLAAEHPYKCVTEAAIICAMLTLQQPWLSTQNTDRLRACQQSFAVYEGDLVTLLNIFRQYEVHRKEDGDWAKRHLLNVHLLKRAAQVQQQLLHYLECLKILPESCGLEVERIQRLACATFFLNAAKRLPNGTYCLCRPIDEQRAPHTRFQFHPSSALNGVENHSLANSIVFVEAVGSRDRASLMHNTCIKLEWLPELAPHYFRHVTAEKAMPHSIN